MTCKFYLPPGRLNAVTTYYVDIIKDAARNAGMEIADITDVSEIDRTDTVVTIENKDFYRVSKSRPSRQIHWFQGIVPEEAAMTFKGHWSKPYRVWFNEWLERYILRHSDLNLFVSEAMKSHYLAKYGKIKGVDIIMPCFNAELQSDVFTQERYTQPSFVYAGSLHQWQCFKPMLELFKTIKTHFPEATLDVYTAETEKAKQIVAEYGVDAQIDCLSPQELNSRLTKYKYGFIVREDDPVNNVASPTKMNTYMAAGVIPVVSDVIETYHTNLGSCRYVILFKSVASLIDRIKSIESEPGINTQVKEEFNNVFNSFWDKAQYISLIAKEFTNNF